MFNVSSVAKENFYAVDGCQINEFPVDPTLGTVDDSCAHTGNIFNPTASGENHGSLDVYAIGDLFGKHGNLQYINSVLTMWDTNLPLYGSNSVVHRPLVFYRLV